MLKHKLKVLVLAAVVSLGANAALASEHAEMPSAQVNIRDTASLQRGAKLFINYCSGCHSLKYLRYSRIAKDLGLTEKQVMANLVFTGAKFGDPIHAALQPADAKNWFGKAPPDLSLEVAAKGGDWVYNYLRSFYLDPSRPVGWNNTVFPNASMPDPLWALQGVQVKQGDKLVVEQPGSMSAAEYDGAVHDITNFLAYAAEPAALQRQSIGVWVILYLALFTLLAYFTKRAFWKDVH